MSVNKQRLINLAQPDSNISHLQKSDIKLFTALKNIGGSLQELINEIFPISIDIPFEWRIGLGNPLVGNDVLPYHYHVVIPSDLAIDLNFSQIQLSKCYITAKVAPATVILSIDIKVKHQVGTGIFGSIFKNTFNIQLPIGKTTAHNVKFAINSLFQDDLLRLDVLTADSTVSDVELVLSGSYITSI